MDPEGMFRSYQVVSSRGTRGTRFQQLLVFTTARRKAPGGVIDSALRHFHVGLRALLKREARPREGRPAPAG
jgi:hypothetical protein